MAKILVVDDEEDICDLLKDLLVDWGHEVIIEHRGDAALERMKKDAPNVVLLDCRMPGMMGQEVLKKMQQLEIHSQVIVTTADVDDKVHEELKALGAVGVITKPFEILNLREQLTKILPLIFNN